MDDIDVIQNADFLSIALEEMERGNHEVAKGFVQDVCANLQEEIDE